jgi:hypothetical protein
MKKIKGNKPIGVIIHIYMELSQRKSLYLKHTKVSCFSFYHFSFFFYKIKEQEGRTGPAQARGLTPVGGGSDGKKG